MNSADLLLTSCLARRIDMNERGKARFEGASKEGGLVVARKGRGPHVPRTTLPIHVRA